MDVFEAVKTVLAVRQYQDKPLPEESIQRILESARLTGSAKNEQPWHFIVVQNRDTLHTLASLAPTGRYLDQAPVSIVIAVEKTPFALSDVSRAIQSMILTAWAEGIGSNWVGFAGMDQVKPVLGIPDSLDVVGIFPFGYPAEEIGQGKKRRKTLDEIAHRERFGQSWD